MLLDLLCIHLLLDLPILLLLLSIFLHLFVVILLVFLALNIDSALGCLSLILLIPHKLQIRLSLNQEVFLLLYELLMLRLFPCIKGLLYGIVVIGLLIRRRDQLCHLELSNALLQGVFVLGVEQAMLLQVFLVHMIRGLHSIPTLEPWLWR